MPGCFVPRCKFSWRTRAPDRMHHCFPRNRSRITKWLCQLNIKEALMEELTEEILAKKGLYRICSDHFDDSQYEFKGGRKVLLRSAFPTQNLPHETAFESEPLHDHQYIKRKRTGSASEAPLSPPDSPNAGEPSPETSIQLALGAGGSSPENSIQLASGTEEPSSETSIQLALGTGEPSSKNSLQFASRRGKPSSKTSIQLASESFITKSLFGEPVIPPHEISFLSDLTVHTSNRLVPSVSDVEYEICISSCGKQKKRYTNREQRSRGTNTEYFPGQVHKKTQIKNPPWIGNKSTQATWHTITKTCGVQCSMVLLPPLTLLAKKPSQEYIEPSDTYPEPIMSIVKLEIDEISIDEQCQIPTSAPSISQQTFISPNIKPISYGCFKEEQLMDEHSEEHLEFSQTCPQPMLSAVKHEIDDISIQDRGQLPTLSSTANIVLGESYCPRFEEAEEYCPVKEEPLTDDEDLDRSSLFLPESTKDFSCKAKYLVERHFNVHGEKHSEDHTRFWEKNPQPIMLAVKTETEDISIDQQYQFPPNISPILGGQRNVALTSESESFGSDTNMVKYKSYRFEEIDEYGRVKEEEQLMDDEDLDISLLFIPESSGSSDFAREAQYLIFESCLNELLMNGRCKEERSCNGLMKKIQKYKEGATVSITGFCTNKHMSHLCSSKPIMDKRPLGNLLLSAAATALG